MTHTLILLRHAKSAWPEGVRDEKRPLAPRGRRDAPAAGRWLRDHAPGIDLVVCSPALRAAETWHLAAGELDPPPPLRQDDRLYEATAGDLLAVTRELPPEVSTALLVGHNPGLEDFLAVLAGARHPLKTAAIAVITAPGSWARSQPGTWTLSKLATPRGR